MKKYALLLFLLFTGISVFAQNEPFEGYIQYKVSYFDLEGNDITGKSPETMDSVQHYFINQSNYLSLDQNKKLMQLYNSSTNIYYLQRDGKFFKLDAGTDPSGESGTYLVGKENKEILGFDCRILIKKKGENEDFDFISEEIFVDPRPFKAHKLGGWGDFLQASEGKLSLEGTTYMPGMYMTMTAIQIKRVEFPEDSFDINAYIGKD